MGKLTVMPVLETDLLGADNSSTNEYRNDEEDGNTDNFNPILKLARVNITV